MNKHHVWSILKQLILTELGLNEVEKSHFFQVPKCIFNTVKHKLGNPRCEISEVKSIQKLNWDNVKKHVHKFLQHNIGNGQNLSQNK